MFAAAIYVAAAFAMNASDPLAADTMSRSLGEITVRTYAPGRALRGVTSATELTMSAAGMRDAPMFMGNADPIRLMQSLPAVSSNSDLTGGLFVQGCGNGQNHISVDGAELVNPMHMLGLFSAFNTPHFSSFRVVPSRHGALSPNCIGAQVSADTDDAPTPSVDGASAEKPRINLEATAGLIDTHASLRVSGRRSRLTLSGRITYLDLLFGSALKIDNTQFRYGFSDWNASYALRLGHGKWQLKAGAFYSSDRMRQNAPNYDSENAFGWRNAAASIGITRDTDGSGLTASFSSYRNEFELNQGGGSLCLPSSVDKGTIAGKYVVGGFTFGADAVIRNIGMQQVLRYDREPRRDTDIAAEVSAAIEYAWQLLPRLEIVPGMRLTLFSGESLTRLYPMPRVSAKFAVTDNINLSAYYGMTAQFTHSIIESSGGLPCDFLINASSRFAPQQAHAATLALSGTLHPLMRLDFSVEGYFRDMSNAVEYNGSILNMITQDYNPLQPVTSGYGKAYGLSVMLMKNYGRLQGWVSYNLGRTRFRFPEISSGLMPTSHDRLHDFGIVLSYRLTPRIKIAANGVYASGYPYTEAAYGYMIGENLICEYHPHNSSRMPAYRRLDVSADWILSRKDGVEQRLNVSLYNALGFKNVLFRYVTYTADEGLRHCESSMRYVIPSVSYTIKF